MGREGKARRGLTVGWLKLTWAIGSAVVVLLSFGSASASANCQRRYRDLALPVYDRLVIVDERHNLTCSQAARIGSAVADAYERGLPTADYPPPHGTAGGLGVPGGREQPFQVHTASYGTYTCRMLARGSDFVVARCRQGVRFVRVASENHYYLHGR